MVDNSRSSDDSQRAQGGQASAREEPQQQPVSAAESWTFCLQQTELRSNQAIENEL